MVYCLLFIVYCLWKTVVFSLFIVYSLLFMEGSDEIMGNRLSHNRFAGRKAPPCDNSSKLKTDY